jgi:carboxymethylenebutenolidase
LGKHFTLTAADKHQLGAYRADPAGAAKGGIVVIQEIFGVNQHIRAVCDRLAGEGYVAVAPALFDRTQKDFECGYTPDEIANARKFVANPDWDAMMRDTDAAIGDIKAVGPTAIMGFCMGGTISFLAATREMPDHDAFRRAGSKHPDVRRRDDQAEAAGLRNLRLSDRRPRLSLRRARQLP